MGFIDRWRRRKEQKDAHSEAIEELRSSFEKILRELVPGGVFELVVVRSDGKAGYKLISEDKRVIVAWSELQDIFEGNE